MKHFREKILYHTKERRAYLCIGLDPRVDTEKPNLQNMRVGERIVAENKRVIEATQHVCACYKPNMAFYECWGAEGLEALSKTLALIPSEIPVILDSKRSDIGATAEAYARAAFEHFAVDAVTLSPYMGKESIAPFLSYNNAFLFILVRTSNPTSNAFQMLTVEDRPLYEHIAMQGSNWATADRLGFVVGATQMAALARLQTIHPSRLLLCPGIGAQGGRIEACMNHGLNAQGDNILPVLSRSIATAEDPRTVAEAYNEEIHTARAKASHRTRTSPKGDVEPVDHVSKPSENTTLIDDLFHSSCFKLGSFTLKSGKHSPFYLDLRSLISFPQIMKRVIHAYNTLIEGLSFHCIAGIPTAGLPFAAALAYTRDLPMIYPRIPKKPHGTGNAIEGRFENGTRALLLDDLITQGTSKHEAISILREASMVVEDLVVLVRRSQKAEEEMRACGVTLHYAYDIEDIIDRGLQTGLLNASNHKDIRDASI